MSCREPPKIISCTFREMSTTLGNIAVIEPNVQCRAVNERFFLYSSVSQSGDFALWVGFKIWAFVWRGRDYCIWESLWLVQPKMTLCDFWGWVKEGSVPSAIPWIPEPWVSSLSSLCERPCKGVQVERCGEPSLPANLANAPVTGAIWNINASTENTPKRRISRAVWIFDLQNCRYNKIIAFLKPLHLEVVGYTSINRTMSESPRELVKMHIPGPLGKSY